MLNNVVFCSIENRRKESDGEKIISFNLVMLDKNKDGENKFNTLMHSFQPTF